MADKSVPLMPVHVVVFPGMVLPLRVEDGPQRELVDECVETEKLFGAVLIQAVSSDGAVVPHAVGTVAEIAKVDKTDEGGLHVIAVGEWRFRIVAIEQHAPFLRGRVRRLPRDRAKAGAMRPLVEKTWRLFNRHMELLFSAASRTPPELHMPSNPELLSFLIAANARLFPDRKQQLLEADSAQQRLRALQQMLKVENDTLKAILATAGPAIAPDEDSEPLAEP